LRLGVGPALLPFVGSFGFGVEFGLGKALELPGAAR
jgi:hypothetical protein